jgi:hypothetical protein
MPVGLPAPRGWQLNRSHGLATCAARGPGGGGGVKACHLLAGKLGPAPRREPRTATGTALEYCMQGLPALGPPLGLSEPGVPACHCHAGGRSTHLPRLGRACLPLPLPCRWPEHAPAAPGEGVPATATAMQVAGARTCRAWGGRQLLRGPQGACPAMFPQGAFDGGSPAAASWCAWA